jgi:hypothetical protein
VVIQVERAESLGTLAQRKVNTAFKSPSSRPGREPQERLVYLDVRNAHRFAAAKRGDAWALVEFGLQLFETRARRCSTPRRSEVRPPQWISVKAAPLIGMYLDDPMDKWSRIPWIGKSVTSVRANSLRMLERLGRSPWSILWHGSVRTAR